jgi:hypothetical protein
MRRLVKQILKGTKNGLTLERPFLGGGHVPHASLVFGTWKHSGGCFPMSSFWGNSGKHRGTSPRNGGCFPFVGDSWVFPFQKGGILGILLSKRGTPMHPPTKSQNPKANATIYFMLSLFMFMTCHWSLVFKFSVF